MGCCLLFVHILNNLLSVLKSKLCFIVSGGIVREFGVHESFADHPYDEVG